MRSWLEFSVASGPFWVGTAPAFNYRLAIAQRLVNLHTDTISVIAAVFTKEDLVIEDAGHCLAKGIHRASPRKRKATIVVGGPYNPLRNCNHIIRARGTHIETVQSIPKSLNGVELCWKLAAKLAIHKGENQPDMVRRDLIFLD